MVPVWLRSGREKTEEEAKQLNDTYQKVDEWQLRGSFS
jgi:hypothetical protein